jgi:polyphosphate kinase 2 (PPK2 family)
MKTKPATRSPAGRGRPGEASSARDHYQREKERRARRQAPESELMAAAKREYLALLEAEAAKGKGGRPKKKPAKPETDEGGELEE